MTKEYKYEVNDEVNGMIILDKIRISQSDKSTRRGYLCKCKVDGYLNEITEYNLNNGRGCPICSKKKTMKGINDIATTHPEYMKYFKDVNEVYKYSYGSGRKTTFICPYCKYEKHMVIKNLFSQGFSCPVCGDGYSYPEKFMINALKLSNIDYILQLSKTNFDWCENKKYDFYLPNYNLIIEVHGVQHYKSNGMDKLGRTLEEEQENDRIKKELALMNGIETYIELDCSISKANYIFDNMNKTVLKDIIKLSNEDLKLCDEKSCNSLVFETARLIKQGKKEKEICSELSVSRTTFYNYKKRIKQFESLNF